MDAARCDDLDVIVIDEEDSVQIDDLATRETSVQDRSERTTTVLEGSAFAL